MSPLFAFFTWIIGGYLAPILFEKYSLNKPVTGQILIQSLAGAIFGYLTIVLITFAACIHWWESEKGKEFRNKEFW